MKDIINNWTNDKFYKFLENQRSIDDDDLIILKNQKINGNTFLLMEKDDLLRCGLKMGPSLALIKIINDIQNGIIFFFMH